MKLVAFAAKSHPAAKKKELTLSDLEHVPIIARVDTDLQSTTHTVLDGLRKQGYKLNIAMAVNHRKLSRAPLRKNWEWVFSITTR
jgi:hypothetical protein